MQIYTKLIRIARATNERQYFHIGSHFTVSNVSLKGSEAYPRDGRRYWLRY